MQPSKKSLSRREFLRAAALTAGAGILAGCAAPKAVTPEGGIATQTGGEQVANTPAPAASNAIQWWVGWGELVPFFDSFKQMAKYKELMGSNDVEMKPSISDEVLFTALAAGTPPDIASNISYLDLFARDVCQDIGSWVSTSSVIKKDDFISGNWDGGFYNGKQYGVPTLECFVRFGMDYNTRMVEAAGLDPNTPPVTWSETLEWHKKLTKFDAAGNLLTIGLDPMDAEGSAVSDGFLAARSWGFKWFDPAAGKFNLDNEKMAAAFDTYAEFYKIVGADKMSGMRQVAANETWGGSFNAEVQAMIIEGYWHPGETQAQKPEVAKFNKATWVPVPDDRRGAKVQGTGGHYVVFMKGAKQTEAGFKFAEFLTTDELCNTIFTQLGWLPAYKPYLDKADSKAFPGLDFYFQSVKDATEMEPAIACPISSFVQTNYDQLSDDVNRGKMTGKDAAAEFQSRCEKEYKNAGFGS
jgi:ABC-type glycerol-3-phosphate transport system substrate-binding protein